MLLNGVENLPVMEFLKRLWADAYTLLQRTMEIA